MDEGSHGNVVEAAGEDHQDLVVNEQYHEYKSAEGAEASAYGCVVLFVAAYVKGDWIAEGVKVSEDVSKCHSRTVLKLDGIIENGTGVVSGDV